MLVPLEGANILDADGNALTEGISPTQITLNQGCAKSIQDEVDSTFMDVSLDLDKIGGMLSLKDMMPKLEKDWCVPDPGWSVDFSPLTSAFGNAWDELAKQSGAALDAAVANAKLATSQAVDQCKDMLPKPDTPAQIKAKEDAERAEVRAKAKLEHGIKQRDIMGSSSTTINDGYELDTSSFDAMEKNISANNAAQAEITAEITAADPLSEMHAIVDDKEVDIQATTAQAEASLTDSKAKAAAAKKAQESYADMGLPYIPKKAPKLSQEEMDKMHQEYMCDLQKEAEKNPIEDAVIDDMTNDMRVKGVELGLDPGGVNDFVGAVNKQAKLNLPSGATGACEKAAQNQNAEAAKIKDDIAAVTGSNDCKTTEKGVKPLPPKIVYPRVESSTTVYVLNANPTVEKGGWFSDDTKLYGGIMTLTMKFEAKVKKEYDDMKVGDMLKFTKEVIRVFKNGVLLFPDDDIPHTKEWCGDPVIKYTGAISSDKDDVDKRLYACGILTPKHKKMLSANTAAPDSSRILFSNDVREKEIKYNVKSGGISICLCSWEVFCDSTGIFTMVPGAANKLFDDDEGRDTDRRTKDGKKLKVERETHTAGSTFWTNPIASATYDFKYTDYEAMIAEAHKLATDNGHFGYLDITDEGDI